MESKEFIYPYISVKKNVITLFTTDCERIMTMFKEIVQYTVDISVDFKDIPTILMEYLLPGDSRFVSNWDIRQGKVSTIVEKLDEWKLLKAFKYILDCEKDHVLKDLEITNKNLTAYSKKLEKINDDLQDIDKKIILMQNKL